MDFPTEQGDGCSMKTERLFREDGFVVIGK